MNRIGWAVVELVPDLLQLELRCELKIVAFQRDGCFPGLRDQSIL